VTTFADVLRHWRRDAPPSALRYAPKLAGRELAQSLGVAVPPLALEPVADPWDLETPPDTLPDLVVKANHGSTGQGVLPLVRVGPAATDTWLDVAKYRRYSWDRVMTWADRVTREARAGGPWFAERVVWGQGAALADDLKVWTIHGRAAFVAQRRADREGRKSWRHWTIDGHPAEKVIVGHHIDDSLPRPRDISRVSRVAGKVAQATGLPVARVDMYVDLDGRPVFGEVTPFPGGDPTFTPGWDGYLVEMFEAGP